MARDPNDFDSVPKPEEWSSYAAQYGFDPNRAPQVGKSNYTDDPNTTPDANKNASQYFWMNGTPYVSINPAELSNSWSPADLKKKIVDGPGGEYLLSLDDKIKFTDSIPKPGAGFGEAIGLFLGTVGAPLLTSAFTGGLTAGVEGAAGSSFPAAAEGLPYAGLEAGGSVVHPGISNLINGTQAPAPVVDALPSAGTPDGGEYALGDGGSSQGLYSRLPTGGGSEFGLSGPGNGLGLRAVNALDVPLDAASMGAGGASVAQGLIGSGAMAGAGAAGEIAGSVADVAGNAAGADTVNQSLADAAQQWADGISQGPPSTPTVGDPAATPPGDTITKTAADVANTPSKPKQFLDSGFGSNPTINPDAELVTGATSGTAAAKTGMVDSLIEWAHANPRLASAMATGALTIAGGIGTAAFNKSAMEEKIALESEAKKSFADFVQNQKNNNAFKGTVNIKPAAKGPLMRYSGGTVYDSNGLINSSRRTG